MCTVRPRQIGLSRRNVGKLLCVEDEYTRFRDMMTGAGYQIEDDIPLSLNGVPAREFIIETGQIIFVRRTVVQNFAIGIHATGARNIHNSPRVRQLASWRRSSEW